MVSIALAHPAAVGGDKMPHQDGDVAGAVAQRRSEDGKYLEPVKEVAAELLLRDHLAQVAVGGRDQANIDRDGPVTAQAFDLAFLERAQQLGLQIERHLADLVQKQRALVRQFQTAHLARDSAGECALLVAEQLAFQQAGRNGGAVELDKRPVAPRAQPVDGARQQLLAGARLSLDQHCGVGGGYRFDLLQYLAQAGALAHDVLEAILQADLFLEVFLLLVKPVAQFRNLAKGDGVVDGHGHLVRNLRPAFPPRAG